MRIGELQATVFSSALTVGRARDSHQATGGPPLKALTSSWAPGDVLKVEVFGGTQRSRRT